MDTLKKIIMILLCRLLDKDSNYIYSEINGDLKFWLTVVNGGRKYDFRNKNVMTLFTINIFVKFNGLGPISPFLKS